MADQPALIDVDPGVEPPPGTAPATVDSTELPLVSEWETTAWAYPQHPDRAVYRRHRDGIAVPTSHAASAAPIINTARAAELVDAGALVPCEVSALAPVLREVATFRRYSVVVEGDEACFLGECDHLDDDGEQLMPCPQRRFAASADDVVALHKIKHLVSGNDRLEPDTLLHELGQLRDLVAAIRDALTDTTGN